MKAAILANDTNSFVPSLAEGLQRMLNSIEVESQIFYQGLVDIRNYSLHKQDSNFLLKQYFVRPYRNLRFRQLILQLKKFDVVIVIGHLPDAFMKGYLRDILLRQALPDTPIVLYSNYYLPTRSWWGQRLKEGDHYGLERYDYYLCTSVVSELPMPKTPQPYSLIGINLDSRTLFPDQKDKFIALLDFQRSKCLGEREIQIQALKEENVEFIELKGSYTRSQIKEIYRKCSIYFVAHRESFGLPICELQACGNYIFTPYSYWCSAHGIKKELSEAGEGELSPNFVVYENDKSKLIRKITRIRDQFSASKVLETFQTYHPQLLTGDVTELRKFTDLLQAGKVHSRSHRSYLHL